MRIGVAELLIAFPLGVFAAARLGCVARQLYKKARTVGDVTNDSPRGAAQRVRERKPAPPPQLRGATFCIASARASSLRQVTDRVERPRKSPLKEHCFHGFRTNTSVWTHISFAFSTRPVLR